MGFAAPAKERPMVAVTEVGTRDGFQAEARFIDTAVKAEIIDAMIAAGVRHIEATSFVSPRAVPQLADAHEVLSRLTRRKEAHIAALVPNARGAERALGAGVDEAVCFVSASETHNRTNLNTSIGDSLANVAEVAKIVLGKARIRGAVACAFGCPFEGDVPVEAAMRLVDAYAGLGFDALTLVISGGAPLPPETMALWQIWGVNVCEIYGQTEEAGAIITGQRAQITRAKKSIAGFKLREGQAIGCKVTLRNIRMYEFLDRLVSLAIPRIRDFRGLPTKAFDGRGNYTFGVTEQLIFPEIEYDKIDVTRGMDITIVTSANTNAHAKALLDAFGFPFRREGQ